MTTSNHRPRRGCTAEWEGVVCLVGAFIVVPWGRWGLAAAWVFWRQSVLSYAVGLAVYLLLGLVGPNTCSCSGCRRQ